MLLLCGEEETANCNREINSMAANCRQNKGAKICPPLTY